MTGWRHKHTDRPDRTGRRQETGSEQRNKTKKITSPKINRNKVSGGRVVFVYSYFVVVFLTTISGKFHICSPALRNNQSAADVDVFGLHFSKVLVVFVFILQVCSRWKHKHVNMNEACGQADDIISLFIHRDNQDVPFSICCLRVTQHTQMKARTRPPVCLSVCLSNCLSVCPPVCHPVCCDWCLNNRGEDGKLLWVSVVCQHTQLEMFITQQHVTGSHRRRTLVFEKVC